MEHGTCNAHFRGSKFGTFTFTTGPPVEPPSNLPRPSHCHHTLPRDWRHVPVAGEALDLSEMRIDIVPLLQREICARVSPERAASCGGHGATNMAFAVVPDPDLIG